MLAIPKKQERKAQASGPHQFLQAGGDIKAAVATPQGISAIRSVPTRQQHEEQVGTAYECPYIRRTRQPTIEQEATEDYYFNEEAQGKKTIQKREHNPKQ